MGCNCGKGKLKKSNRQVVQGASRVASNGVLKGVTNICTKVVQLQNQDQTHQILPGETRYYPETIATAFYQIIRTCSR